MIPNLLDAAAARARKSFAFAAPAVVAGARDTRYRTYIQAMQAAAISVMAGLALFIDKEVQVEGENIARLAAQEGLERMAAEWASAALLSRNVANEFPDSAADWLNAAQAAEQAARVARNYLTARAAAA